MDIGHLRRAYARAPLHEEDFAPEPVAQFALWFEEALQCSEIVEPNAFVLGTAGREVSQRTVLLKFFDAQGFVFYTNRKSRKARAIAENPRVSMLFPWYPLQRQVQIEGYAEEVSRAQSLHYFCQRPRESQLGAWVSRQSEIIPSRALLLAAWAEMQAKFGTGRIPLPDFWGGYRIVPERVEFWQGQPSRLHDRFLYRKNAQGFDLVRLAP